MSNLEDTKSCTVPNCILPTDVTLVSSDGKRFHTHSQNLGEFTGGFPAGISPVDGEEVRMPDLFSEELKLLLWYVHPNHRQPSLDKVDFGTLMRLAEAVEKYEVFPAIEVCKLKISQYANSDWPDHCVDIFKYASKHGYINLMDDTAFVAVRTKHGRNKMASSIVRQDIQKAWDRYTKSWSDLFVDCYNPPVPPGLHKGGIEECDRWKKFRSVVIHHVTREKQEEMVFLTFGSIVDNARHHLRDCEYCEWRADVWVGKARKDISRLNRFGYHMY